MLNHRFAIILLFCIATCAFFAEETGQSIPVDIRNAVNMGFADEIANDGKGGWTDEGPGNDMHAIPLGKNPFAGILFDVIDPVTNGGAGCIALRGTPRPALPLSAEVVLPETDCRFLYLLHAVGWATGEGNVGQVRFVFEDGSEENLSIDMQKEIGNFWNPGTLSNAVVGWKGSNDLSVIGLYVTCLPLPERKVSKVVLESSGQIVWLIAGMSLSQNRLELQPVQKQIITAGDEWHPLNTPIAVTPASILDFSDLVDAPAGKYGHVIRDGDHFSFEDAPEKTIRFYGTNLCFNANYMEHQESEALVSHLASMGYNSLRLHHFDNDYPRMRKVPNLVFDEEKYERIEYLIGQCKKKGLYITIDLLCSREPIPGEIADFPGEHPWWWEFKELVFLSDTAFENWKQFCRQLLNRVNPYTGMAWKDDPVLYAVNLVNEDTILGIHADNPRYKDLYDTLFKKYADEGRFETSGASADTQRIRFLTELYNDRYAEMTDFLRNEIGLKALITDQNNWNDIPTTLMREQYDLVDNHIYWTHPHLSPGWKLPAQVGIQSGIDAYGGGAALLMPTRIAGMPFIVTEWDYVMPSVFAVEGGFLMGAYGAFQNWNGLYHFAYSHRAERIRAEHARMEFFDLVGDPLRQLSERAGALFFLRGDVSPATTSVITVLSDRHLQRNDIRRAFPVVSSRAGLLAATATAIAHNGTLPLPSNATTAILVDKARLEGPSVTCLSETAKTEDLSHYAAAYKTDGEIFTSDTGELTLCRAMGTLRIITQNSEAFLLTAGNSLDGGNFIQAARNTEGPFCAILATSRDGKPLSSSSRILLFHLTDSKNTGMTFKDDSFTILEEWGDTPLLIRKGMARIVFNSNLDGFRLFALDINGQRIQEIPLERNGETASFTACTFLGQKIVCAYELTRLDE